ncbi:hypothetical protein AURDEDRAFT_155799 [Auricularia subglabra TFB-10046 SS5]|nr:hypothetical protein AURDEDRAFT_155799 [Auricularia subglabra TFB-10046 SS5]
MVVKSPALSPSSREYALREYARAIHEHTRVQWLEAERQAKSAAANRHEHDGAPPETTNTTNGSSDAPQQQPTTNGQS